MAYAERSIPAMGAGWPPTGCACATAAAAAQPGLMTLSGEPVLALLPTPAMPGAPRSGKRLSAQHLAHYFLGGEIASPYLHVDLERIAVCNP